MVKLEAFDWTLLNYPLILCPPMDGITDNGFRELLSDFGGSDVLYTEFVNVLALIHGNQKTLEELRFTKRQRPVIIQLFGSNPDHFYDASQIAVELGFDAIDINMGCPAHKVASKGGGCALMGDYTNAMNIVRRTIEGANVAWKRKGGRGDFQVTTKIRLGISDGDTVLVYAPRMADAGSKAIAIHGRTLKQMYTGEANWENIGKVKNYFLKNNSQVKVFGSGDVQSPFEALCRILDYGVDGVMIGRGSFGKPWIFLKEKIDQIKLLYRQIMDGKSTLDSAREILADWNNYSLKEIADVALRHANYAFADKGDKGIIQMRKHLAWYFNSFPNSTTYRNKLVRTTTLSEIDEILQEISKLSF